VRHNGLAANRLLGIEPKRAAPSQPISVKGTQVPVRVWVNCRLACCLAAEAVEGAALALERVDDIHGSDGLAAGVLSVSHSVADDVLEEHLEDRAGLLVDEAGDALHTTTASETTDGGLGDALDVVAEHLAVALGAALAESLTALAATRHAVELQVTARLRLFIGLQMQKLVSAPPDCVFRARQRPSPCWPSRSVFGRFEKCFFTLLLSDFGHRGVCPMTPHTHRYHINTILVNSLIKGDLR
jgi:hypothetical protein